VFRSLGRFDLTEQRFRVAEMRSIVVVNAHRRMILRRLYLTQIQPTYKIRFRLIALWLQP
jgi:hypothetical protein